MYGMLHCQSVISLKSKFKQLFVVLRKNVQETIGNLFGGSVEIIFNKIKFIMLCLYVNFW